MVAAFLVAVPPLVAGVPPFSIVMVVRLFPFFFMQYITTSTSSSAPGVRVS